MNSFDVFNRLVRRQLDPDGSGSQPTTNIFYGGYDGITPTLEFDGTTKDDISHRYLWGAKADQLFADEQVSVPTSNGNVLWPLADHLGTIRDIADYNEASPAFTITNHRVYDTFGRLESETNSAVDLSFGYTGKQFDDASSLNNYLNRWYDPRLGKWLSEDPLGFSAGDANLSRYVGNTATMLTDPLGLAAFDESGAANVTSEGELQVDELDPAGDDQERGQEGNPMGDRGSEQFRTYVLMKGWPDPFRPIDPPRTDSSPTYRETQLPGYYLVKQLENRKRWPPIGPSGKAILPTIDYNVASRPGIRSRRDGDKEPTPTLWEEAIEALQRPYNRPQFDWPDTPLFGGEEESSEIRRPHHDSDDHDPHKPHLDYDEAILPKPVERPKRSPPPTWIPPPVDRIWRRIPTRR